MVELEQQEKQIEQSLEEKTKSKEKLFRILGTIISIVVLVILIVIKTQKPEFPLFWFIGSIVLIVIFFLAMFFGFTLYRKYQEAVLKKDLEGKLPPAITLEQARDLIKQLLVQPEYADYECGWKQHRVYVIGENIKSRILLVQLSPTPYSIEPFQFLAMNMHYPKELYSYFTQQKYNIGEVIRVVNSLAIDPNPEPDTERRVETDLATGRKIEYVKRQKHEKEIHKEKKEDLE